MHLVAYLVELGATEIGCRPKSGILGHILLAKKSMLAISKRFEILHILSDSNFVDKFSALVLIIFLTVISGSLKIEIFLKIAILMIFFVFKELYLCNPKPIEVQNWLL